MQLVLRRNCCKLETAVYAIGLILTALYLLAGLGGVVWFVLGHLQGGQVMTAMRELQLVRMETMMDSLAIMGAVLVVTFIGLLTCLLLILGVRTEQRLLLLPWQLYHAAIILGCFGGGLYQALHFTVLTDGRDSFQAAFALFPVVGGLFFIFVWVLVHQLAIRLRYRRQLDRALEEKRASLASSIHQAASAGLGPAAPAVLEHRSVRSIRTLKRRAGAGRAARAHSCDQILTEGEAGMDSPYYWVAGRSRSLPRNLDRLERAGAGTRQWRTLDRSNTPALSPIPKVSTEKMRRRAAGGLEPQTDTLPRRGGRGGGPDPLASCHSLNSVKNVTIHPEVTQFSYTHYRPRQALHHCYYQTFPPLAKTAPLCFIASNVETEVLKRSCRYLIRPSFFLF